MSEELRRRAARGDVMALRALVQEKVAAGRWKDITLGELQALGSDADLVLPEEASRVCVTAGFGEPPLPGYVPWKDAWIRRRSDGEVRSRRKLKDRSKEISEADRLYPLDEEEDQGRVRSAQVYLLGQPHHMELIEVQEDENGVQEPVDDKQGRYEDLGHVYEASGYVSVELPGAKGDWVVVVFPHED